MNDKNTTDGGAAREAAHIVNREIDRMSVEEGWVLSHSDQYGLCIERDDDQMLFATDDDAIAFVARRARKGSIAHLTAMQIHSKAQLEYWTETLPERLRTEGEL